MITADSITDEQINRVRDEAISARDYELVSLCNGALTKEHLTNGSVLDPMFATWEPNATQRADREAVAELLNARGSH